MTKPISFIFIIQIWVVCLACCLVTSVGLNLEQGPENDADKKSPVNPVFNRVRLHHKSLKDINLESVEDFLRSEDNAEETAGVTELSRLRRSVDNEDLKKPKDKNIGGEDLGVKDINAKSGDSDTEAGVTKPVKDSIKGTERGETALSDPKSTEQPIPNDVYLTPTPVTRGQQITSETLPQQTTSEPKTQKLELEKYPIDTNAEKDNAGKYNETNFESVSSPSMMKVDAEAGTPVVAGKNKQVTDKKAITTDTIDMLPAKSTADSLRYSGTDFVDEGKTISVTTTADFVDTKVASRQTTESVQVSVHSTVKPSEDTTETVTATPPIASTLSASNDAVLVASTKLVDTGTVKVTTDRPFVNTPNLSASFMNSWQGSAISEATTSKPTDSMSTLNAVVSTQSSQTEPRHGTVDFETASPPDVFTSSKYVPTRTPARDMVDFTASTTLQTETHDLSTSPLLVPTSSGSLSPPQEQVFSMSSQTTLDTDGRTNQVQSTVPFQPGVLSQEMDKSGLITADSVADVKSSPGHVTPTPHVIPFLVEQSMDMFQTTPHFTNPGTKELDSSSLFASDQGRETSHVRQTDHVAISTELEPQRSVPPFGTPTLIPGSIRTSSGEDTRSMMIVGSSSGPRGDLSTPTLPAPVTPVLTSSMGPDWSTTPGFSYSATTATAVTPPLPSFTNIMSESSDFNTLSLEQSRRESSRMTPGLSTPLEPSTFISPSTPPSAPPTQTHSAELSSLSRDIMVTKVTSSVAETEMDSLLPQSSKGAVLVTPSQPSSVESLQITLTPSISPAFTFQSSFGRTLTKSELSYPSSHIPEKTAAPSISDVSAEIQSEGVKYVTATPSLESTLQTTSEAQTHFITDSFRSTRPSKLHSFSVTSLPAETQTVVTPSVILTLGSQTARTGERTSAVPSITTTVPSVTSASILPTLVPVQTTTPVSIPLTLPSVTTTPEPSVTATPVPSVTTTPVPTVTTTPVPSVATTPVPSVTSTPVHSVTTTPVPSGSPEPNLTTLTPSLETTIKTNMSTLVRRIVTTAMPIVTTAMPSIMATPMPSTVTSVEPSSTSLEPSLTTRMPSATTPEPSKSTLEPRKTTATPSVTQTATSTTLSGPSKTSVPTTAASTVVTVTMNTTDVATPKNETLTKPGMGTTTIIGIAIGSIMGFWIILGPIVCFLCRMKDKAKERRNRPYDVDDPEEGDLFLREYVATHLARSRPTNFQNPQNNRYSMDAFTHIENGIMKTEL